jgi:hypothetical protein
MNNSSRQDVRMGSARIERECGKQLLDSREYRSTITVTPLY